MSEIWKDVKFIKKGVNYDYTGLYKVSNFGRMKSFHHSKKGKIIKGLINNDGYNQVVLMKKGNKNIINISRLVGFAFVDNPNNKPCINHIDNNRSNNVYTNLEWVTIKENNDYSFIGYARHPLNERQRKEVVEKYKNGVSREKLKVEYKTTTDTIKRLLISEGINVRNLSQSKIIYHIDNNKLVKMFEKGASNKEILKELDISYPALTKRKMKWKKGELKI